MEQISFGLAWEVIQDFYTTYANIVAYRVGSKQFCTFGEQTYVIFMKDRKIKAYYDEKEFKTSKKNGLRDFISTTWQQTFIENTSKAIVHIGEQK